MNLLGILLAANLLSSQQAPTESKVVTIQDASYIGNSQISVTFSYSGGCAEHEFSLKTSPYCSRSMPQQCFAEILELEPVHDNCEAWITVTKTFELESYYTSQDTILKIRTGEYDVVAVELKEKKNIEQDAIIKSAVLTPINPGINPLAFAYRLTGQVQVGGNACQAQGVSVQFRQELIGDELVVTAIRQLSEEAFNRFCTLQYDPIFSEIGIDLRGFTDQVSSIVIRNISNFDNDYTLPLN